jgi:protein-disulfide isomerase
VPRPAPSNPRRSPLLPLYIVLGVVALAGLGLLARQLAKKNDPAANAIVKVDVPPGMLNSTPGMSMGNANAPVVMEFADFQCPHCAEYATYIEPLMREKLVNTGKIRYVFYDFPLGGFPYSVLAHRGGRCANEQGKFWEYHDRLFAKQADWSAAADAGAVADQLVAYAGDLGLDKDKFEGCLRSDKYSKEVSQSRAFGESLQVNSTPTLIANGMKIPAPRDYKELESSLSQSLGLPATAAPAAAAPAGGPAAGAPAAPSAGTPAAPANP